MKQPILWSVSVLWVLFVGLFAVPLGKALESHYLPVVDNFTFTPVSATLDGYIVNVSGSKLRDCKFLRVETAGFDWQSKQHQANTKFLDTKGAERPNISRVPGVQDFGQWHLYPSFNRYVVVAKHRCHFLWESSTPMGEFYPDGKG